MMFFLRKDISRRAGWRHSWSLVLVLLLSIVGFISSSASADPLLLSQRCFASVNLPHHAIHYCTLALKSAQLHPKNRAIVFTNRGEAYRRKGQLQAAIQDFNRALEIDPELVEAYSNRAAAQEGIGAFKYAIQDYNAALQRRPNDPKALFGRGNSYSRLGNSRAAIADYDQAIRQAPRRGEYYFNRGLELEKTGQQQDAVLDFLKALELLPDHPITKAKAADLQLDM